nr:hypothetical protein [Tanacetum cinerariifolium]
MTDFVPPSHVYVVPHQSTIMVCVKEVTLPPRKRLGITLGPRYEVEESSSATAARPAGGFRADYGFVATVDKEIMRDPEREVGYGITDSWDEIVETLQGAPVSTDTELGGYVREFETRVRQDMDEIYTRLDDEQTERQLLAGRLNMLFRDRRAHAYTRQLMETEASDGGISLSEESSIDERNGEVAGSSGDAGVISGDGGIVDAAICISVVSTWVEGGIIESVVSGIVVGIVPNKITRPVDALTLSSDESKKTKMIEIAMTC